MSGRNKTPDWLVILLIVIAVFGSVWLFYDTDHYRHGPGAYIPH